MKQKNMEKHPEDLFCRGNIETEGEEVINICVYNNLKKEKRIGHISFFMNGTLDLIWDVNNQGRRFKERLKQ